MAVHSRLKNGVTEPVVRAFTPIFAGYGLVEGKIRGFAYVTATHIFDFVMRLCLDAQHPPGMTGQRLCALV